MGVKNETTLGECMEKGIQPHKKDEGTMVWAIELRE